MTIYSFSYLEPVCCSMSSSNCYFLICIQISQEACQVVWYPHLLKNFPQFVVIPTIKGIGIVNKAEVYVLLELSCFFKDPVDVGNVISGFSAFSKSQVHILYIWACIYIHTYIYIYIYIYIYCRLTPILYMVCVCIYNTYTFMYI